MQIETRAPLAGAAVRHAVFVLLIATLSLPARGETDAPPSFIEATGRYEFHSHFWLNLHHFLYDEAQQPERRRIEGGRKLSQQEFSLIYGAVDWYRDEFGNRSLLSDPRLYAIKRALIDVGPDELPVHDAIGDELLAQLQTAAPVYRQHYWPRHDRQNREIVAWHRDRIRAIEDRVLGRIAELAQQSWPDGIIRVDLTWDANWAGAYCTVDPVHAVITSRPGGPGNTWPPGGWLELLFHEPSHAVIDPYSSTVGTTLGDVARELGLRDAGQLWHAVLFLISGTAVREALHDDGVDHQLLMVTEGIFSRYQPEVNRHFAAYVAGERDLRSAAKQALEALAASGKIRRNRQPSSE